jgi:hypothetical protein
MRDIRSDLRERLDDIERQRTALISKLDDLDAQRATVGALLHAEQERFGNVETPTDSGTIVVLSGDLPPAHTLGNLMRGVLGDGSKRSTQELAKLAVSKGHPFGDKSPGRSVHFALVGLERAGQVERDEAGCWFLTNGEGRPP